MLTKVVLLAAGLAALTIGVPAPSKAERYDSGDAIYDALRHPPSAQLVIRGATINVVFVDPDGILSRATTLDWIRTSAMAVTTYFGRFPVSQVGLLVVAEDDDRIQTGTTFGYAGSAIRIHVGAHTSAQTFRDDWILVHEMTHLALPTLPRRSLWLEEGNATYVEPIARSQAGQLDPAVVWRWAVDGLPRGQARPGDISGMDATRNHDRVYWGGAAFWLLADIRIRERTGGRMGVQSALQAITAKSGGNTANWTPGQMMAVGDAATGGTELASLYAEMKDTPYPVDVPDLLRNLGVGLRNGKIAYDDTAPLADIRKQITTPPGQPHRSNPPGGTAR